MIRRRTTASATVLTAIVLAVTGCGAADEPDAVPSAPGGSAAVTTTAPPATTTAAPAWRSRYTDKEIKAYEAALQRWDSYQQRSEPIWAAGKATPQAQRLFEEYNGTPNEYNRLMSYESGDVQVVGLGVVLDSRPTEIKLSGVNAGSMSIRQCVDYSDRQITQAGAVLAQITDKPQLRQINMYLGGEPNPRWFIANVARGDGDSPC